MIPTDTHELFESNKFFSFENLIKVPLKKYTQR